MIRQWSTCFALAVLSIASLSSPSLFAQSTFKDKFVGNWNSSKEKTAKYFEEHKDLTPPPEDFLKQMPAIMLSIQESGDAGVQMEEGPDGERKLSGTWKVLESKDDNTADVEIMMVTDGREDAQQFKIVFIADDSFSMSDKDGQMTLVFDRQKKEADKEQAKKSAG